MYSCVSSTLWLEVDPHQTDEIKNLTQEHSDWRLQYIKTYRDFMNEGRFCLLKLNC